jgi:tRNA isopentenyl-2-thiomethyl-A-37 hydroxylase MiaE
MDLHEYRCRLRLKALEKQGSRNAVRATQALRRYNPSPLVDAKLTSRIIEHRRQGRLAAIAADLRSATPGVTTCKVRAIGDDHARRPRQ